MTISSDDDMIVDDYPEQTSGLGNAVGDRYVRATGFRITARVVVHQNERGRSDVEGLANHFARVDRRFVYRAVADVVIKDKAVLRV